MSYSLYRIPFLKLINGYDKFKQRIENKEIEVKLKALSGRAEKKYKETHSYELSEYVKVRTKVLELYPSGHILTVENLEKRITALLKKLSAMNTEYDQADKEARELAKATRTIEEYLRQEQSRGQQQKRKRNDLE